MNPISESLHKLRDKKLTPVGLPPEVIVFAHSLDRRCDEFGKPLANFLILQPSHDFENEILKQAMSADTHGQLMALQDQHEQLDREKEQAIVDEKYEVASQVKEKQQTLINDINQLCPSRIRIDPVHVVEALRSLGFEGDLDY